MSKTPSKSLGAVLKEKRIEKGLSQADVARLLGLQSAQSISDWERNYGSVIPVRYLKKLAKVYSISEAVVYDLVLDLQWSKLEEKISTQFYGSSKRKRK